MRIRRIEELIGPTVQICNPCLKEKKIRENHDYQYYSCGVAEIIYFKNAYKSATSNIFVGDKRTNVF